MSWQTSNPISGTNIVDIPSIHTQNWGAFSETIEDEHYTFSSALSGRHLPGQTAVVSAVATSAVSGISNPASGALVWDSTLGAGKLYTTEWTQVNMLPLSRVFVYRDLDFTVPASANSLANAVPVPFDTEEKDTLSEYDNTGFAFTAVSGGFYLASGKLSVSTVGGISIIAYFSVRSATDIELYRVGSMARYSLSTDECQVLSGVVLDLSAGNKVRMYIYHNHSSTINIEGGADRSFLKIHRLS